MLEQSPKLKRVKEKQFWRKRSRVTDRTKYQRSQKEVFKNLEPMGKILWRAKDTPLLLECLDETGQEKIMVDGRRTGKGHIY